MICNENEITEVSPELDTAMQKTAGLWSGLGTMKDNLKAGFTSKNMQDVGGALKVSAGAGVGALVSSFAITMILRKLMNDTARKTMLEDLIMNDPIISRADRDKVKEFYATIYYLAPKLAQDKNITRELLQNFIKFDRVDLASVKALADTQKSLDSQVNGVRELMQMSGGR